MLRVGVEIWGGTTGNRQDRLQSPNKHGDRWIFSDMMWEKKCHASDVGSRDEASFQDWTEATF